MYVQTDERMLWVDSLKTAAINIFDVLECRCCDAHALHLLCPAEHWSIFLCYFCYLILE